MEHRKAVTNQFNTGIQLSDWRITITSLRKQGDSLPTSRRSVRRAAQCQWVIELMPNTRGDDTLKLEVAILVFNLKYLEETI